MINQHSIIIRQTEEMSTIKKTILQK